VNGPQRAESRVVREQQKPVCLIDISVREQTVAHRFAYILDGFFSGAIHFLRKPLEGYALLIADQGRVSAEPFIAPIQKKKLRKAKDSHSGANRAENDERPAACAFRHLAE